MGWGGKNKSPPDTASSLKWCSSLFWPPHKLLHLNSIFQDTEVKPTTTTTTSTFLTTTQTLHTDPVMLNSDFLTNEREVPWSLVEISLILCIILHIRTETPTERDDNKTPNNNLHDRLKDQIVLYMTKTWRCTHLFFWHYDWLLQHNPGNALM